MNQYLDFKLNAPRPITLRNIMTHTPGYEEVVKDLFIDEEKNLKSLREYLTTHEPKQIFAPGTTPAYCNYTTALAGYIVQHISGQSFDEYIEQHIFQPLDMPHCTFRQPLPDALKPMMSRGYVQGSDPAKDFEIVQAWPAGSSSMTGVEIAHFIIAHMHDGEYQGRQILKPETARLMHSRAFTNLPEMNGIDAIKEIRKNRPDVPILVQTAHAMETEIDPILESGCNDMIAKPFAEKDLIDKILNIL